jgi:hypothetical protein
LQPATTHHYRASCNSPGGVIDAADATFATPPAPPASGNPGGPTPNPSALDSRHPRVQAVIHRGRIQINTHWTATLVVLNSNPFSLVGQITVRSAHPVRAARSHRHARTITFASRSIRLRPTGRTTLTLRLTGPGRIALRRLRHIPAVLTLKVHDATGHQATVRQHVRLQAPR